MSAWYASFDDLEAWIKSYALTDADLFDDTIMHALKLIQRHPNINKDKVTEGVIRMIQSHKPYTIPYFSTADKEVGPIKPVEGKKQNKPSKVGKPSAAGSKKSSKARESTPSRSDPKSSSKLTETPQE